MFINYLNYKITSHKLLVMCQAVMIVHSPNSVFGHLNFGELKPSTSSIPINQTGEIFDWIFSIYMAAVRIQFFGNQSNLMWFNFSQKPHYGHLPQVHKCFSLFILIWHGLFFFIS